MRKRLISLALLVLLIVGGLGTSWMFLGYWWNPASPCAPQPDRPSSGVIEAPWLLPLGTEVIKNQGRVCFWPMQLDDLPANDLRVQVISSGCYSSSCTLVYGRTGRMKIDQAAFTVRLTSRFAVRPLDSSQFGVNKGCLCTLDCAGAGRLEYETGPLQEGDYQVFIGRILVGTVTIPFTQLSLCLDTEHPVR
ncbi:MAG: hypothetical protein AB1894_25455 [Chloroflexota bacterium]